MSSMTIAESTPQRGAASLDAAILNVFIAAKCPV
jgi:hypothetical protein